MNAVEKKPYVKLIPPFPDPADIAGWQKLQAWAENDGKTKSEPLLLSASTRSVTTPKRPRTAKSRAALPGGRAGPSAGPSARHEHAASRAAFSFFGLAAGPR
jgi:hypothetical protein